MYMAHGAHSHFTTPARSLWLRSRAMASAAVEKLPRNTNGVPQPPVAPKLASRDEMPKGIKFIVANEFAERFCYYGINAILTIYMTRFLRLGDAQATTWHSLFKSGAY